jgi:hypothetical protein
MVSDTLIPTPDTTLRKLVIASEQSKVLRKEIKVLGSQIEVLNKLVSQFEGRDSIEKKMYEGQISNLQQQIVSYKDILKQNDKLLKKQKRKTFFTGLLGVAATGATLFLYLKK